MAAIDTKPETRPVRFMGGNADKGTYAIIYADTTFGHGVDHVFVKRYGQEGAEFSWVSVMDDELTQRDCEPAETAAAKAVIADYQPGELTQGRDEGSWRYCIKANHFYCVDQLGQEGEKFYGSAIVKSEDGQGTQEVHPPIFVHDRLVFKAILGLENFDAGYIKEYSNPSRD